MSTQQHKIISHIPGLTNKLELIHPQSMSISFIKLITNVLHDLIINIHQV